MSREAISIAITRHGGQVQPILAIREDVPTNVLAELIADLPDGLTDVFCWKGSWDVGAGGKLTPLRRLKTHPSEDVGGASVGLMSLARS